MGDITERLDEGYAAVVDSLPADILDLSDIAAARARLAPLFGAVTELPAEVELQDHVAPGVDGDPDVVVRTYRPAGLAADGPAVYWIHGGGMVLGAMAADDARCAEWARDLGVVVASVEYRLAPEAPYPDPVHDCFAGLTWFASSGRDLGFDPDRIVISGGSAGGGLAAGTALMARDLGGPNLAGQLLVYPMIDDRNETPSSQTITDPRVWNRNANLIGWASYLAGVEGDPPIYAAPSRCKDLRGLPPTFISVGEHDMFLDEDIAYARALMAAGVSTELKVYPHAFHGAASFAPHHPVSVRWKQDEAAALARLLGLG